MADVIKEYAFKISVEGSKSVIKEFKEIDKNIKDGTETIDKQNKALTKTNSLLWTYAKRLVGIWAIYRMINKGINLGVKFAEQGTMIGNLSTVANMSTKSLQKWDYVLRKFGGDKNTVASTIGSINQKLYERQYGQEPFQEYVRRYGALPEGTNAEEFLLNVAKRMENYNDMQTKLDMADKLGLDNAITNFLLQGSKAVEQQLKNAMVLYSDDDVARAKKANDQLIAFNAQLERLSTVLGGIVLDPLTDVLKEITEFLKDPKKYIASVFSEERKGRPSEYKVAKNTLNPLTMLNWYGKRLVGLTDYSATTGLGGVSDWFTGMMTAGDKNTKVENNITMNITGSNAEEISNKVINKVSETTKASISQSNGAN